MRAVTETYHVEPGREGGWQVRRDDDRRVLASFVTQKEAIDWLHANIPKPRGTEFLLHRRDGWKRAISGRAKGKKIVPAVAVAVAAVDPVASQEKAVVFATDNEADAAAEKVFRLHGALLAELAK